MDESVCVWKRGWMRGCVCVDESVCDQPVNRYGPMASMEATRSELALPWKYIARQSSVVGGRGRGRGRGRAVVA